MELQSNPRGIPAAPFVSSVPDFVSDHNYAATLDKFQEMIQKYKFMEGHLLGRQESLRTKVPEIRKSLEVVGVLGGEGDVVVDVEVNETLWMGMHYWPKATGFHELIISK